MLERTLASAEAVRRRAQEFQRKEVAPLKIGLAPSISVSLVLDPIAEIAKFVPGLRVELRQGSAEKLIELLLEGEINTAMVWDVRDLPAPSTTGCRSRSATSRFSRRHTRSQTVPRFGIDDLRETVLLNAPDSTSPGRPNGRIPRGTTPARALPRSRLAPAAHGRPRLPALKTIPARSRPGFAEGAAAGCAGAPLLASAGGFRLGRAASRLGGRGSPTGVCRTQRSRRCDHDTHAGWQPASSRSIRRLTPTDAKPDRQNARPDSTELLTTFSAADWGSYSHLVGWLRDTDVTSHPLKLGDVAPEQIRRLIE